MKNPLFIKIILFSTIVLIAGNSLADSFSNELSPSPPMAGPYAAQNVSALKKGVFLFGISSKTVAWFRRVEPKKSPSIRNIARSFSRYGGFRSAKHIGGGIIAAERGGNNTAKLKRAIKIAGYAAPNYIRRSFAPVPNDTFARFGFQWALAKEKSLFGFAKVDAGVLGAWDITKGDPNLVVAVADTGTDPKHPDLAPNLWVNSAEIAGDGIDNDQNGYIDDVFGYNFVGKKGDIKDDNFHGSHVAGIIAAKEGNNRGIAGVAPGVKIVTLKVLDAQGAGEDAGIIESINYIIALKEKRGVNIRALNLSLGGPDDSDALKAALNKAGKAGILVVAAAGNNGGNNDDSPIYPANYSLSLSNVISVAANNEQGRLAYFSNYGKNSVDFAAPGTMIFSSIPGGWSFPFDGTSMAAPHVSAIAALVLSFKPKLLPAQVRDILRQSSASYQQEGMVGKLAVPGVVNAAKALQISAAQ
ncbi:MAG TPA: S8 family peptidase [Oligoflexia bacterium]|nr:S8 family peptidase [Oligoflexia bacterium]HMP26886.1 S8 family peptidase [Oligoflexia bacterium]